MTSFSSNFASSKSYNFKKKSQDLASDIVVEKAGSHIASCVVRVLALVTRVMLGTCAIMPKILRGGRNGVRFVVQGVFSDFLCLSFMKEIFPLESPGGGQGPCLVKAHGHWQINKKRGGEEGF